MGVTRDQREQAVVRTARLFVADQNLTTRQNLINAAARMAQPPALDLGWVPPVIS